MSSKGKIKTRTFFFQMWEDKLLMNKVEGKCNPFF